MAFRSCLQGAEGFFMSKIAGQWNIFYIFGQRMQSVKFLNGKYMAKSVKEYIEENEARFLEEWFSLIRIPSVSADPAHKNDMVACAERWRDLLLEAGADEARLMPSSGNPLVYAEKRVGEDAPTVLVYGHYDVMPAEPLDLWKSDPFEPEVRDGHVFARGADDDKGQSMIQLKAFEYMVREGALRHNVKVIL